MQYKTINKNLCFFLIFTKIYFLPPILYLIKVFLTDDFRFEEYGNMVKS